MIAIAQRNRLWGFRLHVHGAIFTWKNNITMLKKSDET